MIERYDREAAVAYAHKWAFARNPRFADFEAMGGDCTNFASQVLMAGGADMNYTPITGWYYLSLNQRAPAWTGVAFLHRFLIHNRGPGPFATEAALTQAEPGDILQLSYDGQRFNHCPVVVSATGGARGIRLAAHSADVDNRPLSDFPYKTYRLLHIEGIRR